jgi:hypothetical protein
MGLNHMNGRVQDAILGRFISPDPHVPDPTNAQSYNRYSYVNNNPLTLIDPSGFCGFSVSYDAGSVATYATDGDGNFVTDEDGNIADPTPVTPGSYTLSPIPDACTVPNYVGSEPGGGKPGHLPIQLPPLTFPPIQAQSGCPNGLIAQIASIVIQAGQATQTAGQATAAAGTVLAIGGGVATLTGVGAPAGAPTAAFGVAAMGVGGATTLVGNGLQLLGGYVMSTQGNGQPLYAAELQTAQTLIETILHVPTLPIGDPTDPLVNHLAGQNPCP